MKHHRKYLSTALASLFVAYCGAASGAVIYTQTLGTTPAAVVNNDVGNFSNCVAAEGCFGTPGNLGASMPAAFTFNFTLTPAQVLDVTNNPGTAILRVVAARDIGHKVGVAGVDFMVAAFEGTPLGNLFQNTIDTCPAGERGSAGYPADLVCGPNFHTDVTALDSAGIAQSAFQAAAADGTISVVLDPPEQPNGPVGRLKIFSVTLEYTTDVPEPATLGLAMLGLAALGFARRRKPA